MNDKDFNLFNCNGIMLEPRLQEYIKKKRFYKENSIEPSLPLEREFHITKDDIALIKSLFKGTNKNFYKSDPNHLHTESNLPTSAFSLEGFTDADKLYKSDPRYKNYQEKKQKDKNAMSQRNYNSYDNSAETYRHKGTLDGEVFFNHNQVSNDVSVKFWDEPQFIPSPQKIQANRTPKIMKDVMIHYGNNDFINNSTNDSFDELETYATKLNKLETRNLRNEKDMIQSIGCRTAQTAKLPEKTIDYENNSDHAFQFVDSSVNSHYLMDRGIASRLDNHGQNKTVYHREIVP